VLDHQVARHEANGSQTSSGTFPILARDVIAGKHPILTETVSPRPQGLPRALRKVISSISEALPEKRTDGAIPTFDKSVADCQVPTQICSLTVPRENRRLGAPQSR
jgi:hypothetical protein